jgi:hypothetical protein
MDQDSFEEDNERWEDLREDRYAQLGTRDPSCSVAGCAEMDPFALTGTDPDIVCYEHRARAAGRSWREDHHVCGHHNDSTDVSEIPGNDHRPLSFRQDLWPEATLRNPDGSPLLRAAAALRGWLDVLRHLIERSVGWIPAFLESLEVWLVTQLGAQWWDKWDWTGQP